MELLLVHSKTISDSYVHGIGTSKEAADKIKVVAYDEWVSDLEQLEGGDLSENRKLEIKNSILITPFAADKHKNLEMYL